MYEITLLRVGSTVFWIVAVVWSFSKIRARFANYIAIIFAGSDCEFLVL